MRFIKILTLALTLAATSSLTTREARAQWGGWESLGGIILEEPNCVSWGPNRIDCFARGTNAAMFHRWWNGSAWGGWENLGGIILEAPNCVSWGPNRIDCFARGTDQAMFHRWWDGNSWGGWENLGGVIRERPECVSWGANRIDCFARGLDSAMWHRWWNGSAWGGWENLGGVILEGPSCVSWGANRIDCFARGTDAAMWHRWWDGNSWGGWESLGGVILEAPNCVSWGANRIDCFARGTDRAMWHRWWNGSAWGGWESLGGIILEAPNCVSWGPNRIDCFARGTNLAMFHRWWDGNSWGGWENLGGVILEQPNCVSWAANRIDCFARGTDRAMFHRWWPCPTCAVGTRKSVNSLTAAELMSLRKGVAAMMARNSAPRDSADYRRSWIYWANMHAHFGADCAGPISGAGMAGVQTFTATNAAETATWCKCQHGTQPFLTWHRMYLWYFERVLQQAAGDPSLRLPYWDYATNPGLPAAYRDATYVNENGATVPNPLRVDARQASLNAGTSSLGAGTTSSASAMTSTSYVPFNNSIQATPHGAVHCAVGVSPGCPNGLMGSVPVSALDPIFYAHHTNIDRLYECWLKVNEPARLPTDSGHLNTQFSFIDADGSTATRKVSDMLRLSQLGYAYATGGGCPAGTLVAEAEGVTMGTTMSDAAGVSASTASEKAIATVGATRLERGVTTVPMNVAPAGMQSLSATAEPLAGRRVRLVIDGLKFDSAPGTLYNVYMVKGGQREQVGIINFFNFTAPQGGAHAHHTGNAAQFEFDATDAVHRLGITAGEQPSLVFEPTTGLSDSAPEAAAALIKPDANVRFDSARLVVAPPG
ncbi:tyrosinase family protein [Bradyrhizobium liaoningense]|uniref:tyrosinase family protein n=1 Tax=Bradyrhizobium liaoningense TaxID=43992 RepID=UPI001BAD64F5|nr:tyrosinase family protein [Bradyrhizobium liaoningense]MBR0715819.1 tyrosinase family protein [Bradyrhizobium liaoningense]